ncbi:TPA: hypothetical protein ACJG76_004950, partial [Salmonella enterica subsp. diarizonae serovar 61:i:z]
MKYIVTIMNDTSLVDNQGIVHTWLVYQEEGKSPQYFSFASDGMLKPYGFQGVVSDSDEFGSRPTSRTYPIEITQDQFIKLKSAIHDFSDNPPIYDFTPKGDGDYNCTTATLHVLEQAGIKTPFSGVNTPFGVTNVIDGIAHGNNYDNIYASQNEINTILNDYFALGNNLNNILNTINPINTTFEEMLLPGLNELRDNAYQLLESITDWVFGNGTSASIEQAVGEMLDNIRGNYGYYEKSINDLIDRLHNFPNLSNNLYLINGIFWGSLLGPSTTEATSISDPVVLDLNGDGVKTISKSSGIIFDHDGNFFAENTGWISPEDGLLVMDKNQDGKIDSGNELFGNNSLLNNGSLAKNGYEALREYDENHDGVLDKNDSIWRQLKVWQDKNSNAVVDDGELLSLEQLKITSIRLDYENINFTDSEGNKHLQKGLITYEDGHTGIAEDLGLDTDKGKTQYVGDATIDDDVLSLPYIRGFGNMADLQLAMSYNDTLKKLVSQYVSADDAAKYHLVKHIIYTWAGVSDINPHSRGSHVDAQHLGVLEAATGETYHTVHDSIIPNSPDGVLLEKEYNQFYGYVNAMLQAQTTYKDIFSKIKVSLNKDGRGFTLNFKEIEKYIFTVNNQSEALNLRSLLFSMLSYMPQFDDVRNSVGVPAIRDSTEDNTYYSGNNHTDYYFFEKGHGHDVIEDYAQNDEQADTVVFSQAQSSTAAFDHVGNDLVIRAYGDDNSVTLRNYFSGNAYRRYHLVFDDATLEA